MEIFLAIAVASVALAGCVLAARFNRDLHEKRKDVAELWARLATMHESWSAARDSAQASSAKLEGAVKRDIRQIFDVLDKHHRNTSELGSYIQHTASEHQESVQRLQGEIKGVQEQAQALRKDTSLDKVERLRREKALNDGIGELTRTGEEIEERLRRLEAGAERVRQDMTDVQSLLAELRQRIEQGLAGGANDIAYLDQHVHAIRQGLRLLLDHEPATLAVPASVLPGLVLAAQPAAADILPELYDAACRALSLEVVLREPLGRSGTRFYLRNPPDGPPLERRFGQLLLACPDGSDPSEPGIDALRRLLLAAYCTETALIRLGPMIVVRTGQGFLGAVLTPAEIPDFHDGDADALADRCAAFLRSRDSDGVLDLATWAARYASG